MFPAKYIHINMDKNKRPKLYTLPDTLRKQSGAPPWFGTACAAACDVQSFRVRWG